MPAHIHAHRGHWQELTDADWAAHTDGPTWQVEQSPRAGRTPAAGQVGCSLLRLARSLFCFYFVKCFDSPCAERADAGAAGPSQSGAGERQQSMCRERHPALHAASRWKPPCRTLRRTRLGRR
ncbi:hypothetical protein KIL84_022884 [Mauremys mutica]|uniref:Uncharacterized protein n=1 Tax=Mauremys mutica TaxID=74926 RepID=A0A9D3WRH7_9SAUR|nr:hypothetical protein KIL84_022884 [Mauremys mutica]